jgi:hypothetical protein
MAELTMLESKLGEILGLAMAAKAATQKVKGLVEEDGLKQTLDRMHAEAAEAEVQTTKVAETFDGKKTAILEKARETKQEATEMMSTYLGDDADGLDGFEFLTMAEAGEVGHWAVVGAMNENAGHPAVRELVAWGLPIQERHLQVAMEASQALAAAEDPNAPAS